MTLVTKAFRLSFFFFVVFTLGWPAERLTLRRNHSRAQLVDQPNHIFADEIQSAFAEIEPLLSELPGPLAECTRCEIISVVAPEVIRYRSLFDMIETATLEVLYVNRGKIAADFSIGIFQMKPSFIELIESELVRTPKASVTLSLPKTTRKIERHARLERMKRLKWQVYYAHAYWSLCNIRFSHRTFSSVDDRISFYAAAYNYGFYKDEKLIERWMTYEYFPYGKKYKGKQTSYHELTARFYNHCLTKRHI